MAFFNQKQEVMDVKLTQFGKNLLSRGFFKPVYYQFFDDDILYNSSCAGFSEHQNDSENRILKETPRLKTQHLANSVETRYMAEEELIEDGARTRFEELKKTVFPHVQEKILMYPMANQEIETQSPPRFDLASLDGEIKKVKFTNLTGSGVIKKEPILDMTLKYILKEDKEDADPNLRRNINNETFVDLTSDEVVFSDNSKLKVLKEDVIIDLQELNCFTGLENFYLNIYEVIETPSEEDDMLVRLDTMEKVNKYFTVKLDQEVESVVVKDEHARNHYKRGEN